ncbi:SRPBCC domain-containing protein [Terrabacter sp. C0L_2]|jgi:carbon monoxide dehydrogenase subunit G|uniref:SRPBCC domain-containing protein n=1 Tax=Terrabacter sp. C0L_2 TaxID=3108389 RepID=UPI002ED061BE|nr:SRPBCC domain-containing protein [Terrabacter sp. C0L_2]
MRLGHEQELDAPQGVVWANFMDLHRIGRSFPGAKVTEVDGDDFVGEIKAKLGPLSMYFDGTGSMVERDEDRGRARLTATGQERHGLGRATIDITLTLHPVAKDERTRAHLVTDLVFLGFPMDFGTGLVQRASDPLIERFLTLMAVPGPVPDAAADDDGSLDLIRSATDLFGSFRRDRRERKRR